MLKLSGNDLDMLLHSMNYRNAIQSNRLKIITKTIRTFKIEKTSDLILVTEKQELH